MSKICSKCKVEKDAGEFYKHKNHENGLSSKCKDCDREYHKEYYQKNKEGIIEKKKEYRKNNKEKVAEINRKYHEKNKEDIAERKKKYREKNPYHAQSDVLSNSARKRARNNKLLIDLDFISRSNILDWLKRQSRCECCNVEFSIGYKGGNGKIIDNSPSLDRFDPDLGYVPGNVFLICSRCNLLKNDATVKELKTIVAWMKQVKNQMVCKP